MADEAIDVALALADAFERAHLSYAIGGAIAYGIWGIPRYTKDADVNVFVDDIARVIEIAASCGVRIDPADAARHAPDGMIVGWRGDIRADLFLPSIDFSFEAERRRVRATIEGRPVWVLSAECITVFKLLFFRGKDIVDLERLIGIQGKRLDVAWIRAQIVDMAGADDVRVKRWDELVAEHGEK